MDEESPKIAILGLNPHAGEDGLLGEEEEKIIKPAIKELKDQTYIGMDLKMRGTSSASPANRQLSTTRRANRKAMPKGLVGQKRRPTKSGCYLCSPGNEALNKYSNSKIAESAKDLRIRELYRNKRLTCARDSHLFRIKLEQLIKSRP